MWQSKHAGSKRRHKRWASKRMERPHKIEAADRGYRKVLWILGL